MKCKHCNGFGWYYNDTTETKKIKCECCGGTGEVEQTNEEWFCSLSTEEKARWLNNLMWWLYPFVPKEENKKETLGQIIEWLKEKHDA